VEAEFPLLVQLPLVVVVLVLELHLHKIILEKSIHFK
jgi:hypothetical protein